MINLFTIIVLISFTVFGISVINSHFTETQRSTIIWTTIALITALISFILAVIILIMLCI